MPPLDWTSGESATALFFASRGACVAACQALVYFKFKSRRSVEDVRTQLDQLRFSNGFNISSRRTWRIDRVDSWLLSLGMKNLQGLLEPSKHDLEILEFFHQDMRTIKENLSRFPPPVYTTQSQTVDTTQESPSQESFCSYIDQIEMELAVDQGYAPISSKDDD